VVVWPGASSSFGPEAVRHLNAGTWLLDASIGAILPEGIQEAHRRGVLPVRVNIWPALAGTLQTIHEYDLMCRGGMGHGKLDGIPVVAGGTIGHRDDVIVDSIREPTRVVGVADGRGGIVFRYGPEQAARVQSVAEAIRRRLIAPRTVSGG